MSKLVLSVRCSRAVGERATVENRLRKANCRVSAVHRTLARPPLARPRRQPPHLDAGSERGRALKDLRGGSESAHGPSAALLCAVTRRADQSSVVRAVVSSGPVTAEPAPGLLEPCASIIRVELENPPRLQAGEMCHLRPPTSSTPPPQPPNPPPPHPFIQVVINHCWLVLGSLCFAKPHVALHAQVPSEVT